MENLENKVLFRKLLIIQMKRNQNVYVKLDDNCFAAIKIFLAAYLFSQ